MHTKACGATPHSILNFRLNQFARFPLFLLLLLTAASLNGQTVQIVRGHVIEKETQAPIIGATVRLITDSLVKTGVLTDDRGSFRLENVTVGKHTLKVSFPEFRERILDITVTSGKEVILTVEMEELATSTEELVITANKRGEVINDMALVSVRSFDVAETERYAGSRGDPARMASNFAGVQGADDSRNDIVVRGNSPLGVLYRLEGFDIPNPNHFSIAGSTGGPVSILNNKVLSNSDFFTSAFPAEYGNSTAAAFDLKLRKGNNEKHEFSGQFGILGTELAAEGPISRKTGSSYMAVYRYSTLSIFQKIGIQLGTDAVPRYQDATFKLNFPVKERGNLSFFGIGGMSAIDILISDQEKPAVDFYGDDDRDQYFKTRMSVLGANYSHRIGEKTLMKTGLAVSHEQQYAYHEYIIRHLDADSFWVLDSLYPMLNYTFRVNKLSAIINFNTKISKNHVLKYGVNLHGLRFNFQDSALTYDHSEWQTRWNYVGHGLLAQVYLQWKWKPNDKLTFTGGLHNQFFTVSKSVSILEPRIGMKYQLNQKHSINLGGGMHSQVQPFYTYFYQKFDSLTGQHYMENREMGFSRSLHSVVGYDFAPSQTVRIKLEAYYQYLYQVPVEVAPSAFSLTNMGSGFARFFPDKLQNTGTGRNYGVELTVEKYFNKSFYFLATASLFDAKYTGSDGVLRNTDFNGGYAANLLAGKEFKLSKKSMISLSGKVTTAGGRWYGVPDTLLSAQQNELIFLDSAYNTFQFRPYFRADLRLTYKINAKKVTHEISIDLVNLLNTQNILSLSYSPNPFNPSASPIAYNYQLGFLPLFYYRIDF